MANYSAKKIKQLLDESDSAPNVDVKGDKLEELVKYLFERVKGTAFLEKNILDGVRAHELDLVFEVDLRTSELYFLECLLFIECKNTGHPLGSAGVGWFVRKLQDRAARFGILVSLSGITGANSGVDNAHSEVLGALIRDRIQILLMDRAEVLALGSTRDLADLLKEKMLKLAIKRTVG